MGLPAQVGLVALGSAVGGLLRWGVATGAARWLGTRFPYGSFLINLSGALFLGWFATVLTTGPYLPGLRTDELRLLVVVGFTGAYTTFSTFEYESHALLSEGDRFAGLTYLFASTFLGLVAARAGVFLAGG